MFNNKYMGLKGVFAAVLIVLSITAFAQEVTFVAKAPSVVRNGEQFQIRYTITGDFKDFKAPSMAPFEVLSGPNQSRSSNFEFRNGKSSSTTTTSYSYWLQAGSTGDFTIEPGVIQINKKESRKSNPVSIKVVSGNTKTQSAHSGTSNTTGRSRNVSQSGQKSGGTIQNDDVMVRTEVSQREVYIGEQFVVSEKIYTRLPLAGFGDITFPSYSGFWAQEVEIPGRISLERVALNNQVYNMGELKRTILFPQKTGKIDLQQTEVEAIVQVKDNSQRQRTGNPFIDDPFFNPRVSNVPVNCIASKVVINVLPLPTEGKPAGFGGAVGQFTISSSIDKTTLKANEAITLKYKISGTGNLPLIDLNNVRFPHDFEVYDPKVSKNIKTSNNAVTGTISFEYVLIPRSEGTYAIPPVTLAYFDPAKKKYVTLRSSQYEISVEEGAGQDNTAMYQSMAKEEVQMLGEDIRYIKTIPGTFNKIGTSFLGSAKWFLSMALIILLAAGFFVFMSLHRKRQADVAGMKNKQANRLAKKRLRKAELLLKENKVEVFYEEISNALWGYLADKLTIPTAELNSDNVRELLSKRGVLESTIEKFFTTVSHCDYARFAPGDLSSGMESVYDESIQLITLLEKNF